MPSMRALALRRAIERAAAATASVTTPRPGRLRITVPISADVTPAQWSRTLHAIQTADLWGASDGSGTVAVWAELKEET